MSAAFPTNDGQASFPTIDKRLAAVCQRFRAMADEIERKASLGVVCLFIEEHVIESHRLVAPSDVSRSWRVEVLVPELSDYQHTPEDGEQVPLPPRVEEACSMLRRVVEECRGVRGIDAPCAPSPEVLHNIVDLLKRTDSGA